MITMSSFQRENYERTDHILVDLKGLIEVLDDVIDGISHLSSNNRDTLMVRALISALQAEAERAQKAHSMEWAGFGGTAPDLTDAEIAEAKGETAEVAA